MKTLDKQGNSQDWPVEQGRVLHELAPNDVAALHADYWEAATQQSAARPWSHRHEAELLDGHPRRAKQPLIPAQAGIQD